MAKKRKKENQLFNIYQIVDYNTPKITFEAWTNYFFLNIIINIIFSFLLATSINPTNSSILIILFLFIFFTISPIIVLLNRQIKSPYLIPIYYILDIPTKMLFLLGSVIFLILDLLKFYPYFFLFSYLFSAILLLLNPDQCQKLNQLISDKKRYSKKELSKIAIITYIILFIITNIYAYTTNQTIQNTIIYTFFILFIISGLYILILTGTRIKLLILDLINQKQSTPKK